MNTEAEERARKLLAQLADAKSRMEHLLLEKENTLPVEVRKIIEEVNQEYQPRVELIEEQIRELEDKVKEAVIEAGGTIKGLRLHAIFVKGKNLWDNSKLEGYAASHPEVLTLRTVGKPSVQIRQASGGKKSREE